MKINEDARLLRIFLGESDKFQKTPLCDAIVMEARKSGLAGATVWKGTTGFGASSRIRTAKILDLSADLPIVIEIVDNEEKIEQFLPVLSNLFESGGCGGLVTIEKVKVISYTHKKNKNP